MSATPYPNFTDTCRGSGTPLPYGLIRQGDSYGPWTVTLYEESLTVRGQPDLTRPIVTAGATALCEIREGSVNATPGAPLLTLYSGPLLGAALRATAAATRLCPAGTHRYDFQVTFPDGTVWTAFGGDAPVVGDVSL